MTSHLIAFCVGAMTPYVLPAPWPIPAVAACAAAGIGLRRLPLLASALCGLALAAAQAHVALATAWPCTQDGDTVTIEGRIMEPALVRPGRTDFDLEVTRLSTTPPWPRQLRLSWYDADRVPAAGESWRLQARLRCRRGFANPGAPDRELALLVQRIDATGYVAGERPQRLATPPARPVERLRGRIARAIADAVPAGAAAPVLQGLSVGVRGNIPDPLWEAFSVTGVAHLVAISGLHVTGCALAALVLLRLAWRSGTLPPLRHRSAVEGIVVVTVTGAYALLSGASVPALRTLAMVAAFAALRLSRRFQPLDRLLALAAAALLAADPLAGASAGFWLSFVATAALLAVGSAAAGWRARAVAFGRSQMAVTLLLTPVLSVAFGRVSLVSPLVNAIAIPLFGLAVLPAVLAGTVLSAIAPEQVSGLWRVLAGLLEAGFPALQAIAGWPAAVWSPVAQPLPLVLAAGLLLLAALLLPLGSLRCAAAALLLAVTCGGSDRPGQGAFDLTVVDVGQGLAAVVETAGHALLFDTGPSWRGGGSAAQVSLLPWLRARGIRRVDRLIVSHDDADHAGGQALLTGTLEVRRLMAEPESRLAADEVCRAGNAWRWDGVDFVVVHPPSGFIGGDNDRSCALRVSGPGGSALLLADAEARAEAILAARAIAADVVLVPHHGSARSSSQELVAAVSARIAVASAGFGNRWGMPRAEAVARWRQAGTTVIDTASAGSVRVRVPHRRTAMQVEAERRDRPRWWRAQARP